jgi:molybdopterin synthase catalytic subunit
MIMIEITEKKIDVQKVIDSVRSPDCGAVSVFIGMVRNHSRDKDVNALEYEVYGEMAEKMIEKIIDEIKSKWEVDKIAVSHRIGKMEVGEITVAIAVSAPHRKDSIPACQYAIDRLKEIVPIWKKEYAVDGVSWVEPHA